VTKLGEMDNEIDISSLFRPSAPIRWLDYNPSLPMGTFKRVDMGSDSHLILQSSTDPNACLKIDQETFFKIVLATTTVHEKATVVVGPLDKGRQTKIKGLPDYIDASKPPKNFQDAMLWADCQEWAEALNKEYMGFKQRGVFELVPLQKVIKLMGMTTRCEYKVTNGTFDKAQGAAMCHGEPAD
jgi:hypothetical protein